jgi:choline dehydrogenase
LKIGSPQYDLELVKRASVTIYHPTGTCRMSSDADDKMAVCDERGRVRGVRGLRCADLSLCPEIVGGNTQVPAMMIGEKIASHILEDAKNASSTTSSHSESTRRR